MNFKFERFSLEDEDQITDILLRNIDYAGRIKNVKKMIEWNILHQDDLYRKIVNDNNDIIGYIGYDDASLKENTRKFATPNDLYLEIYLHPNYTNKGLGVEIFKRSLEYIPLNKSKIYASTYTSNLRAQRFLIKCGMKYIGIGVHRNTFIYEYKIR